MRIAIDGPAGAGKSTIARALAERLDHVYLDTGAMYRAIAHQILQQRLDCEDSQAVAQKLPQLMAELRFVPDPQAGTTKVFAHDCDITRSIRSPQVSSSVSVVAQQQAVRRALLKRQQQLAKRYTDIVMDGRDIGTVVMPHADLKIFLSATLTERVRRRAEELRSTGYTVDLAELEMDLTERDAMDSQRSLSPLRKADDAIAIDSTALSPAEVIEQIIVLYRQRQCHV